MTRMQDARPLRVAPAIEMREDASVEQVASMMNFAGLPAIIVLDAGGEPAGVLSRSELLSLMVDGRSQGRSLCEAAVAMEAFPRIAGDASASALLRLALAADRPIVMVMRSDRDMGFVDMVDMLDALGSRGGA